MILNVPAAAVPPASLFLRCPSVLCLRNVFGHLMAESKGRRGGSQFAIRCLCGETSLVSVARLGWTCPSQECRQRHREVSAELLRLASDAARKSKGQVIDLHSIIALTDTIAPLSGGMSDDDRIALLRQHGNPTVGPRPVFDRTSDSVPTDSIDGKNSRQSTHSIGGSDDGYQRSSVNIDRRLSTDRRDLLPREAPCDIPPVQPPNESSVTTQAAAGRRGLKRRHDIVGGKAANEAVETYALVDARGPDGITRAARSTVGVGRGADSVKYRRVGERTRELACDGCDRRWFTYPDAAIYDAKRPASVRASMKEHKNKVHNCRSACKRRNLMEATARAKAAGADSRDPNVVAQFLRKATVAAPPRPPSVENDRHGAVAAPPQPPSVENDRHGHVDAPPSVAGDIASQSASVDGGESSVVSQNRIDVSRRRPPIDNDDRAADASIPVASSTSTRPPRPIENTDHSDVASSHGPPPTLIENDDRAVALFASPHRRPPIENDDRATTSSQCPPMGNDDRAATSYQRPPMGNDDRAITSIRRSPPIKNEDHAQSVALTDHSFSIVRGQLICRDNMAAHGTIFGAFGHCDGRPAVIATPIPAVASTVDALVHKDVDDGPAPGRTSLVTPAIDPIASGTASVAPVADDLPSVNVFTPVVNQPRETTLIATGA